MKEIGRTFDAYEPSYFTIASKIIRNDIGNFSRVDKVKVIVTNTSSTPRLSHNVVEEEEYIDENEEYKEYSEDSYEDDEDDY